MSPYPELLIYAGNKTWGYIFHDVLDNYVFLLLWTNWWLASWNFDFTFALASSFNHNCNVCLNPATSFLPNGKFDFPNCSVLKMFPKPWSSYTLTTVIFSFMASGTTTSPLPRSFQNAAPKTIFLAQYYDWTISSSISSSNTRTCSLSSLLNIFRVAFYLSIGFISTFILLGMPISPVLQLIQPPCSSILPLINRKKS